MCNDLKLHLNKVQIFGEPKCMTEGVESVLETHITIHQLTQMESKGN